MRFAHWVEDTTVGLVAYLLITHPPARRPNETADTIAHDMRELGTALGLHPARETLQDAGPRLLLGKRANRPVLNLDETHLRLHVPPVRADWQKVVEDNGTACTVLGLTPLDPLATHREIVNYMRNGAKHDLVYMGLCRHPENHALRRDAPRPASPLRHSSEAAVMDRRVFVTSFGGITEQPPNGSAAPPLQRPIEAARQRNTP
ncbi:hypothetical protein [Streptomyces abikoensis]|uniref:hypothetical protein n=1 Tax=Streptomyces abikoensis TaxID=97398 RepID=UPI0036AB0475